MCAEVAVDYIARQNAIDSRRDHFLRASAARRLFEQGVLPEEDLADLLIRLNNKHQDTRSTRRESPIFVGEAGSR